MERIARNRSFLGADLSVEDPAVVLGMIVD
jgi:hypothetical protein